MSKIEFIITQCVGNWEQAIQCAKSRGMFLPSIEMAKDYNLPYSWTCNTDAQDSDFAFLSNGESRHKRLYDARVILCSEQYTEQDVSYQEGDIKEFKSVWYDELE